MLVKTCSIEGCVTSGRLTRGWCFKHYKRWQVHGDPLFVMHVEHEGSVEERFWAKVDKTSSVLGCWLWSASKNHKGYGEFGDGTRVVRAHRYSYALRFGIIPEGMQVDHKLVSQGCPRHCVNPEHLRLVTNKQNQENRTKYSASSGYRGVRWKAGSASWEAWVIHNKVRYYFGSYKLYELHVAAYYARLGRNELYTHNDEDEL